MHSLLLEVILVVVNPTKQSGNKSVKVRSDQTGGKCDGEKLDETEGGFDDFSVFGPEEDCSRGDELVERCVRYVIFKSALAQSIYKLCLPLNSKISLERALILALIMCGVVPVRPAATIVMNSSTFASTEPKL